RGTVYRIDLRKYRDSGGRPWGPGQWDRLLRRYPYGVVSSRDPVTEEILGATNCPVPYVRADWFAFAVSRPPLYHDLLDLPLTIATLERRLGVYVAANVRSSQADRIDPCRIGIVSSSRSGSFTASPARNNRILERHDLGGGRYYWKSYDFAGN